MFKLKYLKYRSKYLNLKKELTGGGIEELKLKYPDHTELIDKIYDPTNYSVDESEYILMIKLYIANPRLKQFIEYKPSIDRLHTLLDNIDIVEILIHYYDYGSITDKLIGLYFINKNKLENYIQYVPSEYEIQLILEYANIYNLLLGYNYKFKDINENLLKLLKSSPELHEFIRYGLNLDKFNFILKNIELFRLLLDNNYRFKDINEDLIILLTTEPILQKFIKYKLRNVDFMKLISNIIDIELYTLLLENNYSFIGITPELLDILKLNPVLHQFVKYKLLNDDLQFILENIEDVELFKFLLENGFKDFFIENYILYKFKDIFTKIPEADTEDTKDKHLFNPRTYYNSMELVEENYNVGIEIEGCTKDSKYNLENFTHTRDLSVKCNTGENIDLVNSEFILNGKMNKNKLSDLDKDIKEILDILSYKGKFICSKTCGIHFHISNEYILFNLYGLLFLTNLIILWLDEYQEKFISTYPYQIRIYKESYSKRNNSIFRESMVKLSEHITQFIKENDKFDDYDLVMYIFRLIKSVNNKENFLNVYEDHIYIHIEFRGLASVAHFIDIDSFIRYVKSITDLYQKAIDISIRQISS